MAPGQQYQGDTLGEAPHGQGTMTYADGSSFDGMWHAGQRVKGKMTRAFTGHRVREGVVKEVFDGSFRFNDTKDKLNRERDGILELFDTRGDRVKAYIIVNGDREHMSQIYPLPEGHPQVFDPPESMRAGAAGPSSAGGAGPSSASPPGRPRGSASADTDDVVSTQLLKRIRGSWVLVDAEPAAAEGTSSSHAHAERKPDSRRSSATRDRSRDGSGHAADDATACGGGGTSGGEGGCLSASDSELPEPSPQPSRARGD
eukprot:5394822-Prymnesium_polylepis.1